MMLSGSTVCVARQTDARMNAKQAVREIRASLPLCGMPSREDVGDRHLEGDREDVEAREHVFSRRATGAAMPPLLLEVDQVEDALFVELIGIVGTARR